MITIDVYKVSRTDGEIIGMHSVPYYRTETWKAPLQTIIDKFDAEDCDAQVLWPKAISGVDIKRTRAQLDYDKSQTPIWRGTDLCGYGTAREDYVSYSDDVDFMGTITPPEVDEAPRPTAYDVDFSGRTRTTTDPQPEFEFPREYRIASSSVPDAYYDVKLLDLHSGICHCKGFAYRRRCSHVEKAKLLAQAEMDRR
jgi:hypothetical protein